MTDRRSSRSKLYQSIDLRPALALIWQSGPRMAVATLALTLLQGALPLISLYLLKLIVDAVEGALGQGDVDFAAIAWLIGLAAGVALLQAGLQAATSYVGEAQSVVLSDYMFDRVHTKSSEVDLEYYENPEYHDTLHLAQQQTPHRPRMILQALLTIVQNGVSLVAVAGLLFLFHWSIPLVLVAAALPGLVVRLRYAETIYRWHRSTAPRDRLARYLSYVLTQDSHAKEMRLFDLSALFTGRFLGVRKDLRGEQLEIARKRAWAELVAQGSGTLAIFGSLVFIAWRTFQGSITLGDLVMYFQAFQRGQNFLREMMRGLGDLYGNNLYLNSFYELMDLEPKVVDPPDPKPMPQPIREGIVFERVSFKYPEGERTALREVDLEIHPGETIALVGSNGAGKTTLVKLLCRLYEPSGGRIMVDGIDLREIAAGELRREISVVFQDYAKYHTTARENIWFGDVRSSPEDARVDDAARLSGVDEALSRLPKGYETLLGKWFESGEELSIGEWQKVALARAFLREAQITILDEPTSALDARTEVEVIERFRELARDRTAILISHRLSTVKMADRIYVMDGGQIVESGSHQELMAAAGVYARLFSSQASYYQF